LQNNLKKQFRKVLAEGNDCWDISETYQIFVHQLIIMLEEGREFRELIVTQKEFVYETIEKHLSKKFY
jgi:hypothetical protein